MSMLAFFPWMEISGPINAGQFELLPYRRGVAPGGPDTEQQSTFDRLLEPYHAGGSPVVTATIVRISAQEDPIRDLSPDERNALFVFSEVLGIAGLAAREFFSVGALLYQNRDNFRLVIQGFSSEENGVTIVTRRRDGSTRNYWSRDSYRAQKPDHIHLGPNRIDRNLLECLLKLSDASDWQRIYEAILGFNLANTDSLDMSEHIEAVLTIGAFERVFDLRHGKEDELAQAFLAGLTPAEDRHPSSCARLSEAIDRFKTSPCIREMWIRDFFRLRNNLAHGMIESRYQPAWSLQNHLLLASFVFPLILKSRFQAIGAYTLSENDQRDIDMFEQLACEDHFVPIASENDPQARPWNRIRRETIALRLRRRILADLNIGDSDDKTSDEG